MSIFQFKQFSISHHRSTMKVGTDAVLLGSWVAVNEDCRQILDIGCGCGIIALMLAQRSNATITGIDIDKSSIDEAAENAQNSPWKERINFQNISVQDFCIPQNKNNFDLIVSNPPFFEKSLKSPIEKRNLSRHTDTLSFEELIVSADYCLSQKGHFAVIIPAESSQKIENLAFSHGLFCFQKMKIHAYPNQPANRTMLVFSRQEAQIQIEMLIIRDADNSYTDGYRELAKWFYLQF